MNDDDIHELRQRIMAEMYEGFAFRPGDRVQTVDGPITTPGTIKAAFATSTGLDRYVFEFDRPKGALFIFTADQLERIE